MTVIPFPRAHIGPEPVPDPISLVVAALSALGEPATSSELADLLGAVQPASLGLKLGDIESVLAEFSVHGATHSQFGSVFRPVLMHGATAWAFTPSFRSVLRARGLPATLRPLL